MAQTACDIIEQLRRAATFCRAMPRVDLLSVCAGLQIAPVTTAESHAEALVRVLPEAFGSRVQLLAPGTAERSFDEAWLHALLDAHRREDTKSLAFLLRRRVAPDFRRGIRFLIGRIVDFY